MFRIAEGEPLGYDDPVVSGHSIEFRINAEDAGPQLHARARHPTTWRPPFRARRSSRRGIPQRHDRARQLRLADRQDHRHRCQTAAQALERSAGRWTSSWSTACRRSFHSTGPFWRTRLITAEDGRFGVHTRWIETEFSGQIPPYAGAPDEAAEAAKRSKVVVEVNGKRLEVMVPAGLGAANGSASASRPTEASHGAGAAQGPRLSRAML